MKIVADRNIALVAEAFAQFGDIELKSGRHIDAACLKSAEMLLTRSQTNVDATLLTNSPVGWVGCATSGIEHVDTGYLQKRGIGFADARGSNAVSVSEYILSVLAVLCELRHVSIGELTIGVVGYGEVGTRLITRLEALGVRCLVNDPPLEGRVARPLLPLADVLRADVVTLHVPLTTAGEFSTRGLIAAGELRQMPEDSVLINAARGGVVDERAWLAAHTERPATAAVVDCWCGEPAVNPDLLARAMIATPHIAGHSYDGKVTGTGQIYTAACSYFGEEAAWVPSCEPGDTSAINAAGSLQRLLLACYDVRHDSADFKRCASLSGNERAAAFDRLRSDYPRRREFSTRRLIGDVNGVSRAALAVLGFEV